jgi:hypothetical protein
MVAPHVPSLPRPHPHPTEIGADLTFETIDNRLAAWATEQPWLAAELLGGADPRAPVRLPPRYRRRMARTLYRGRRGAVPVRAICSVAALRALQAIDHFLGLDGGSEP